MTARPECASPDNETRVAGGRECLVVRTFRSPNAGAAPTLLIYLHGDGSSGGPSHYIYGRAQEGVADGVVSVALLRPGYFDRDGNRSTGDDRGRRDGYTSHNVDAVAAAVKTLKAHHRASRVILVGHSGGAAISGVILGRHPGLVDGAVLGACPCEISRWRQMRGGTPWNESFSPSSFAPGVPASAHVIAVTGDGDTNTFPALARDYVAMLTRRGVTARFVLVPGAGHDDVMRRPELKAAITEVLNRR